MVSMTGRQGYIIESMHQCMLVVTWIERGERKGVEEEREGETQRKKERDRYIERERERQRGVDRETGIE